MTVTNTRPGSTPGVIGAADDPGATLSDLGAGMHYRSTIVPRWWSVWGLLGVAPSLVATLDQQPELAASERRS